MNAPSVVTDVGCAGLGDNFTRGHSVRDELFGVDSYWSLLSLSIGGARLSAAESRFLDDLAVAICSPDPRIWPLKATWLVGSYGSPVMASAAALLFFEGAIVGPWACVPACAVARELRTCAERSEQRAAITEWLEGRRAEGQRIPGFGVAMREEDERVSLIRAAARRSERAELPHCRALELALPILAEQANLRPNIGAALAACLLDLGYSDTQVGLIAVEMVRAQLVGNAVGATELRAACLRHLPEDFVCYRGRAPRLSPRALEREGKP